MTRLPQTLILTAMIAGAINMPSLGDNVPDPRLCVDGHPRPRAEIHPHITYGGLNITECCQRDHFIPLGLCIEDWCDTAAQDVKQPPGPDNPGNVWYQPWSPPNPNQGARVKDAYEKATIRAYCKGKITLDQAWLLIRRRWSEPNAR